MKLEGGQVVIVDNRPTPPAGFVDLGLPSGILWYNKNIGATNDNTAESWYGDYYAWGETETKNDYSWSNYTYANGSYNKLTKYCNNSRYGNDGYTDELTQLVSTDDIAAVTNSTWRMPTKEDFEELIAWTFNEWVTNYNGVSGLNGRVFTGNGNTLFIPATGVRHGSSIYNIGSDCNLWTSTLYNTGPNNAYQVRLYSTGIDVSNNERENGLNVRPVYDPS